MNISDLLAKYGDDKVSFQKLDDCATDLNMTKNGTRITFVTPERIGLDGLDKLGLVVWLDRKQVASILADERNRIDPPKKDTP